MVEDRKDENLIFSTPPPLFPTGQANLPPFRLDNWLLHVVDSPSASGGRGLARGRFFDRAGRADTGPQARYGSLRGSLRA